MNLYAEDEGSFVNVFVGESYRDACFTIHKDYREWGTAPEDNRPTWERLCELAGLDPDDAEPALNAALDGIKMDGA